MKQVINEEIAKKYSFFTKDENLKPDTFYLFEDVSNSDTEKMDRLQELKNKTYNTSAEKEEMAKLLKELENCMINSEDWTKLVSSIYSMQIYLRDEIVVFIKDKQDQFTDLLDEFKFVGLWNSTISYKKGNQVSYGGFGFQSRKDDNLGNKPNIEATMDDNWVKYTLKGEKGEPSLNIYCRGTYSPDVTYNLSTGDACIYDGLLFYVLSEGVKGIPPTDDTKWKVIEECVASDVAPSSQGVLWLNTSNGKNTLNKNIKGTWIPITLDGKTARGNLGTDEKKDLALAITEVNTKTINLTTDLNNVKIKQNKFSEDGNGRLLYNNKNVGVTTASELPITTISGLSASNVQEMGQQLFTFANNGKNAIAGVVGNVNSSSTFSQIRDEIQNDKNILASKLSGKGIGANGSETLSNLANKVGNISAASMGITLESLGGVRFVAGVTTGVADAECGDLYLDISSQCNIEPKVITFKIVGRNLTGVIDLNTGYRVIPGNYVTSSSSSSHHLYENNAISKINTKSVCVCTYSSSKGKYYSPLTKGASYAVEWYAFS